MSDSPTARPGPGGPPRRSLLFVPAHRERFVHSAATSGADVVILDLEDSVPPQLRPDARSALAAAANALAGTPVVVRVNSGPDMTADLAACRDAHITEILVPKVQHPRDVHQVVTSCAEMDYAPTLSILIESMRGLADVQAILTETDISAVAVGIEDVRAELELFAPTVEVSETLVHAHSALIVAALGNGVTPLGLVGSIAEIDDETQLRRAAVRSWRMGYRGSFCVHPKQVPIFNDEFQPNASDLRWARAVEREAEAAYADGRGAFRVDGRMVDAPMLTRAQRIRIYGEAAPEAPHIT